MFLFIIIRNEDEGGFQGGFVHEICHILLRALSSPNAKRRGKSKSSKLSISLIYTSTPPPNWLICNISFYPP